MERTLLSVALDVAFELDGLTTAASTTVKERRFSRLPLFAEASSEADGTSTGGWIAGKVDRAGHAGSKGVTISVHALVLQNRN